MTFKYAIWFYKSASISDLSQGVVSVAIYYNVLFVLTIVLTPVFSVFEFIALCTSIFYSPEHFGAESKKIRRPTVSILKTDDDEDFDWLERGDRSKFQEKEVLLPPEAGAKRWSRRTASQRSSSR